MGDVEQVPGIGPKKGALLRRLGCASLESLCDADGDELYQRAQIEEGRPLARCVLYAFRCAVAYAADDHPDPDAYRWWFFTDESLGSGPDAERARLDRRPMRSKCRLP